MRHADVIERLQRIRNFYRDTIEDYAAVEAINLAISALEKQEQERWRRYPAEKPKGGEIVLVTMPAYTDRNGDEHHSGVICAYHIDNYHGGWWGRSDGVTYGALGMCDVDPVAWRPLPEAFEVEEEA